MEEKNRKEIIYDKGFDMVSNYKRHIGPDGMGEYNSVKVGVKKLEDALLNLGTFKRDLRGHAYTDKTTIYRALMDNDLETLRNISNFYYNLNGMYKRVCDYIAFLYRYDWYLSSETYDKTIKPDKILKEYIHILNFLDASEIKATCGQIALEVVKNGCYYGYIVPNAERLMLQQLPANYCRSIYQTPTGPAVEFNMKFFDKFTDPAYKMKVLDLFPEDFKKGYILYKKGKLYEKNNIMTPLEQIEWTNGWYLLDPKSTVKFNFNGSDAPIFVNAIPALLDLDQAQDLDRRKQMQKLLKIIVQKLPRDKNGDLIFDIDEATDLHNNVVEMLRRAVGVDVLTTFADIDSIDMSDKNTTTTVDDLSKVERSVYNALGISKNIFNTEGNLALEKSILSDESFARNLLLQFSNFYNRVTQALNLNKKKFNFKLNMLETTQFNYKELSKMYKEQTQLGFSKLLPQIALGQSQSFIINSIMFENDVLDLSSIMIPPLMSSTMSSEDVLGKRGQSTTGKNNNNIETKEAGRPEKADDEKSAKTIQNRESMS